MGAPRSPALALLLFAACPDPDDATRSCPLRSSAECDVRELECQQHVREVVSCVRGVDHPLPDIDVLTPAEYAAEYRPPPRTAAEQLAFDRSIRAFKLLGLFPADWVEQSFDVSPPRIEWKFDRRRVVIVADRQDLDFELHSLLYVTALADRDRESDLLGRQMQADTFDRKHGLTALYAGEAQFFADLAWSRARTLLDAVHDYTYAKALSDVRAQFGDPSVPWWNAIARFWYAFGADFVKQRFMAGDLDAITAAYEDMTASTAHALAGDIEIDAAFSAVDTALPPPPPGFFYESEESFGPALYYMYLLRRGVTSSGTESEQELARTWIGDRIILAATDASDALAVVWQIAGPGGTIADTTVVATDDATLAAFQELFPGT